MIYINRFFSNISKQLKTFYLNSNIYDKKISRINDNDFFYKPPFADNAIHNSRKKKAMAINELKATVI